MNNSNEWDHVKLSILVQHLHDKTLVKIKWKSLKWIHCIQWIGRKFHKPSKVSCSHRRHHKLENLRTLILGDNQLTGTSLWLNDEGTDEDVDSHLNSTTTHKSKLLFPNLGALDLSNNRIKEIPHAINEMTNLSVFNISGNSGNIPITFNFDWKFNH